MSDLEKALALIEKEKLEKTGELDLRDYDLTELPEKIRELVWLKELTLSEFFSLKAKKLEKLPNWIDELKNLQGLVCSNTKIDSLEPIYSLSNLQLLYCYSTKIDSLEPIIRINSNQELKIFAQNCPLVIPPIEFLPHGYSFMFS